jgi:nucleoid-associated protein YgaU
LALLITDNLPVTPPKASPSATPHPSTEWPKKHTIASGDTLTKIARQYYDDATRKNAILAANPQIKSERHLKIGDVLTLPAPNGSTGAAPSSVAEAKPIARPSTPETSANSQTAGRTYKVQKGDTLYSIAKKQCGSSSRWEEIVRLNKDVLKGNPSRLSNGMILKLPENTAPAARR